MFCTLFNLGLLREYFTAFLSVLSFLFFPLRSFFFYPQSNMDEKQKFNLKLEKALSSPPFSIHRPHGST